MKVSQEQMERVQDYAETFGTESGKRVLEDLRQEYGGECFVPGDLYGSLHQMSCRDFLTRIEWMIKMAEGPLELEQDGD